MANRFIWPVGFLFAFAAPVSAHAAPTCLANGKSFNVGDTACLTVAEDSHFARCEMVLNNTSWTKVKDECPGEAPKQHPTSTTPAPSPAPTEPTEN